MTDELPILVDLHRNVFFDEDTGEVFILDRRKLPGEVEYYRCSNYEDVARAIELMVTQSLGVSPAAGYGMAIASYDLIDEEPSGMRMKITEAANRIKSTRPTQTSLHYLVDEMVEMAEETIEEGGDLFGAMWEKAYGWTEEVMQVSRKLGEHTSNLIEDGDTILTHCYGGPGIYFFGDYARREGKDVDYLCTETRPYLQGARLTSFALCQGGFDVTLITDSMPAYCMEKGLVDKFITGADRVAMDGGVANKIGTYQVALAADRCGIPFYALSYTGPDPETTACGEIEVEERNPSEVTHCMGERTSPENLNAYYPAFDCTPPDLIEGVVTDRGVYSPESVSEYYKQE